MNPINTVWLIKEQSHKALCQTYRARHDGMGALLMKAEDNFIQKKKSDFTPYEAVGNGVAIVRLVGVLTKGISDYAWLTGGTSMKEASEGINNALTDTAIKGIILYIDSPGGTVDGTESLAKLIFEARGKKPIIVFSNGQICSAAYWIGAAADKIYISGKTIQVGGIGVVACHVDVTEKDKMFGEKITEITAGKYKRIAGNHSPLSDDGRAYLQDQVDSIYNVFIESVANYRKVPVKKVLSMADGKIFIGQDALEVGLIDGICTFDEVIQVLSAPETQPAKKTNQATSTQTFENLVYVKCTAGMSQQQAFSKTKKENSALFADFNKRLKSGAVGELFPNQTKGGKMQH